MQNSHPVPKNTFSPTRNNSKVEKIDIEERSEANQLHHGTGVVSTVLLLRYQHQFAEWKAQRLHCCFWRLRTFVIGFNHFAVVSGSRECVFWNRRRILHRYTSCEGLVGPKQTHTKLWTVETQVLRNIKDLDSKLCSRMVLKPCSEWPLMLFIIANCANWG